MSGGHQEWEMSISRGTAATIRTHSTGNIGTTLIPGDITPHRLTFNEHFRTAWPFSDQWAENLFRVIGALSSLWETQGESFDCAFSLYDLKHNESGMIFILEGWRLFWIKLESKVPRYKVGDGFSFKRRDAGTKWL